MGRRKCIGILYNVNNAWIGGTYYIQNLISSLCLLDDSEKPSIDIYTKEIKDFNELVNITGYPYLVFQGEYRPVWYKLKILHLIHRLGLLDRLNIDVYNLRYRDIFLFPVLSESTRKGLFWMPDFQSERLPEFFSQDEIEYRRSLVRGNALRKRPIVLSSNDCLNDYKTFFPELNVPTFILNFAVTLPDLSSLKFEEIAEKYGINGKYFFCANQFWAHKNHLFLFNEFREFVKKGNNVQLVCTGALLETRNDSYIEQIRAVLKDDVLEKYVKILGFIPRKDMLCLMKNAEAVIQPSLFEGWSTVVEDAKALNKFVFLSDIPVHKEQMKQNVSFFCPRQRGTLVECLENTKIVIEPLDYNQFRHNFAQTFLGIINNFHCSR